MKFLVIGLGSMGKRRVRNLLALGYKEIFGYDIREDRLKEAKRKYKIKVYSQIEDIFSQKPDLVIISTSPNTHLKYVQLSVKRKIPFFTEVNTNPNDIKKIIQLSKKYQVKGISSLTMRFHPAIETINNRIMKDKLGKIRLLTYHSGEHLEDWHPWEKVQDYYVGNIATGGGRDQAVFELEWIFWLFGRPSEIMAKTTKLSKIPAKIFDTYQMTIKLEKVPLASVIVDVIQRPQNRILRIIFEKGLIEWDWIAGKIRIYHSGTKKWEELGHGQGYKGFNVEEMYLEEMKNVIRSIKTGKNFVHSFEDELQAATAVVLAEKSSKIGKKLKI